MDRDRVSWARTAATRCDEHGGRPTGLQRPPADWLTPYI